MKRASCALPRAGAGPKAAEGAARVRGFSGLTSTLLTAGAGADAPLCASFYNNKSITASVISSCSLQTDN
jgi:hypothetical protein